MAQFVYRGYHEDVLQDGNVYSSASLNFDVALILQVANPGSEDIDDPSNGVGNVDMVTVNELFSRAWVTECSVANYARIEIPVANRGSTWDTGTDEWRLRATQPVSFGALLAGQTIQAYVLIRRDTSDLTSRIWMCDTSPTGAPAPTNGQEFTVTLNTTAFLRQRQGTP